jgi:AcrR family transcriptional regulator
MLTPADETEFRNRVCDAVVSVLVELGHDAFNMRLLARRLGVSAMTTYRYFKDKDEILAAVRARGFACLADKLEAATQGLTEHRIVAAVRAYVEFARADQAYYKLMFNTSNLGTDVIQKFQDEEIRARAVFTGIAPGLDNAESVGLILWSSLNGIMSLNLSGKISDSCCDKLVSETIRLLVRVCDPIAELRPSEKALTEDWPEKRTNGTRRHRYPATPAGQNAAIP